MASIVCMAVEVVTDGGDGLPLAYTNTDIGLYSDGHFYWVTDRPGFDGSKTIAGDTTRTIWKEGILAKESGFSCSREIDIVEAGNLSSASSFSFGIVNTSAFWNTLNANGVYLGRCVVKFYIVTSSDGVTYTFRLRWTGIVDDQPFTETTYKVECIDNYKAIFTQLPPLQVNSASFPDATQDSLGKSIPVAIGRVAFSPLANVVAAGKKTDLVFDLDVYYPTAAAFQYDHANKLLYLNTRGILFLTNDVRLKDRFISVTKGGPEQVRRILSNDATVASTYVTLIELDQTLDDGGNFEGWSSGSLARDIWYFEVSAYSATLLGSTKPIAEFRDNSGGRKSLFSYDGNAKSYVDNSELTEYTSPSNVASTGHPGFKISAKSQDTSGDLPVYFPIVPSKIVFTGKTGSGAGSDTLTDGDLAPNLNDKDQSTFYLLTGEAGEISTFTFDVYFPRDELNKTLESLHVLWDYDIRIETTPGVSSVTAQAIFKSKDLYGRDTENIIDNFVFYMASLDNTFESFNYLPYKYFGAASGDDGEFYEAKGNTEITELIPDVQAARAYNVITVTFSFSVAAPAGENCEFRLKELGFVGRRNVNVTTESQYSSLKGEVFGSTFGGRYAATDPVLLLHEAAEYIPRVYDFNYPLRTAAAACTVDQIFKSTSDNGHLYICTVAGTTGADKAITGAANNGSGLVRITAAAHGLATGNEITIAGVVGTTEANGNWTLTVITANTYDLQGSTFANAYVSGGTVTPNFTTTAADTFTDGSVTWRELRTIPIKTAAFDTLGTFRPGWFVGRTHNEKRKTAEVLRELAVQGFFGFITTASGQLAPKTWVDNLTSVATFSSANILPGSLGEVQLTPMSRVSNDFVIRYAESPGAGGFAKQIAVTKIDRPSFPAQADGLFQNLGVTVTSITRVSVFSTHTFIIECDAAPDLQLGDFCSLSGSTGGFDFSHRQVNSIVSTAIFVRGHQTPTTSGSGGTLVKDTGQPTWKEFVAGIEEYQTAKGIWDNCHASYVVCKSINKLPAEIGDCRWFIDPKAQDPAGKLNSDPNVGRLWPDLNVGDEHPAVFLARFLSRWTTWQKKRIEFEVAMTSTTLALELLDPITFNDAKLTNGQDRQGWIDRIVDMPDSDDRLRIGVILSPDQLASCNRIIDTAFHPDRLIDTAGAPDRIILVSC